MSTAVEFQNVSIVFGNRPQYALPLMDKGLSRAEIQEETDQVLGVHDCSLSVEEGNILVLMGLSGSGKSTLLRAVNGLNAVARGSILVRTGNDMVDVTRARPRMLRKIRRKHVAMVFQQFGLLPWRTVRENVGLGLELGGMRKSKRNEKIDEQLELVGLSDWAERRVGELSGGMQQRVGLARAFATEAPILLMDEPFSALDPLIRARLQDELLDLQEKLKRTIIFVSHDLDEAFKIGNHIAIMEGGRISQSGTPADIFASPADDYVADFVAHMNPLGVLTARDVMEESPLQTPDHSVNADTPIQRVIELITGPASPLGVTDRGERIGVVTRASILRGLVNRSGKKKPVKLRAPEPAPYEGAERRRPEPEKPRETEAGAGAAAAAATAGAVAASTIDFDGLRPADTLERKIPRYQPELDEQDPPVAAFYPDVEDETLEIAVADTIEEPNVPEEIIEETTFEEPVTFRMDERLIDYADDIPEELTVVPADDPEDIEMAMETERETVSMEVLEEDVSDELDDETPDSADEHDIDSLSETLEFGTLLDEEDLLPDSREEHDTEADDPSEEPPARKPRKRRKTAKQLSLLEEGAAEEADIDAGIGLDEDDLLEEGQPESDDRPADQ